MIGSSPSVQKSNSVIFDSRFPTILQIVNVLDVKLTVVSFGGTQSSHGEPRLHFTMICRVSLRLGIRTSVRNWWCISRRTDSFLSSCSKRAMQISGLGIPSTPQIRLRGRRVSLSVAAAIAVENHSRWNVTTSLLLMVPTAVSGAI